MPYFLDFNLSVLFIYRNKIDITNYMELYESSEDYLEKILMLEKKNGSVRAIDIAKDMNFSKPSVSVAMHKLEDNNYITIAKNGEISLTPLGREIAEKVYERHVVLTKVLVSLGIPEEIAAEDACKIEHDLSEESFEAIKRNLK